MQTILAVVPIVSPLLMSQSRDAIQTYNCHKTDVAPALDGRIRSQVWSKAEWTETFIDIRGVESPTPRFKTQAKMLWDDQYLYFAAEMEEPHVWTTITEKNSVIYWQNDFEIFIDPDGDGLNYYEFEVNALNTIWELSLDKPYNKGGSPTNPANIKGLISSVFVDGTINNPNDTDVRWSVEVAIPWEGLKQYNPGRSTPPQVGETWRINFSRVQWQHKVVDGKYVRIPDENRWDVHHEDNWVWSNQGEINMHKPEMWGKVVFC